MRFYRVSYDSMAEGHEGYTWHASRREAVRAGAAWHRRAPVEGQSEGTTEIDVIDITPTKVGLLVALNRFASHNANG